jgi:hypothetical protein
LMRRGQGGKTAFVQMAFCCSVSQAVSKDLAHDWR